MASASATEVFNCSPDEFMKIIADYERYPEFLTEVSGCKVVQEQGNKKLVEYSVSLIKTFKYQLWMTQGENEIHWDFGGGDVFKTMSGSWTLKDEAGKTRATYAVDASFKGFVPGPIAKGLIEVNLPNMMSAYHKRVKQLYGR